MNIIEACQVEIVDSSEPDDGFQVAEIFCQNIMGTVGIDRRNMIEGRGP